MIIRFEITCDQGDRAEFRIDPPRLRVLFAGRAGNVDGRIDLSSSVLVAVEVIARIAQVGSAQQPIRAKLVFKLQVPSGQRGGMEIDREHTSNLHRDRKSTRLNSS